MTSDPLHPYEDPPAFVDAAANIVQPPSTGCSGEPDDLRGPSLRDVAPTVDASVAGEALVASDTPLDVPDDQAAFQPSGALGEVLESVLLFAELITEHTASTPQARQSVPLQSALAGLSQAQRCLTDVIRGLRTGREILLTLEGAARRGLWTSWIPGQQRPSHVADRLHEGLRFLQEGPGPVPEPAAGPWNYGLWAFTWDAREARRCDPAGSAVVRTFARDHLRCRPSESRLAAIVDVLLDDCWLSVTDNVALHSLLRKHVDKRHEAHRSEWTRQLNRGPVRYLHDLITTPDGMIPLESTISDGRVTADEVIDRLHARTLTEQLLAELRRAAGAAAVDVFIRHYHGLSWLEAAAGDQILADRARHQVQKLGDRLLRDEVSGWKSLQHLDAKRRRR
jgi:hypothetical protein